MGAVQVGTRLWTLSSPTLLLKAGSVWWGGCEYLQAWRLLGVSRNPFRCSITLIIEISLKNAVFSLFPLPLILSLGIGGKSRALFALFPPTGIYLQGHILLFAFPSHPSLCHPVGTRAPAGPRSCPFPGRLIVCINGFFFLAQNRCGSVPSTFPRSKGSLSC